MHYTARNKQKMLLFFLALLVAFLVSAFSIQAIPLHGLSAFFYSFILIAWALTIKKRIINESVRHYLLATAMFLISLFVIRQCRWDYFILVPGSDHILWYFYYLPMLAVPLLSFYAALCVGKTKGDHPTKHVLWLWGIAFAITAVIFTNDLHGYVLKFYATPGGADAYERNWFYYIYLTWIVVMEVAAFVILMRKTTLSQCRRKWYVPVAVALLGILLLIFYFIHNGSPMIGNYKLYQIQEVYALVSAGIWEACIQIGLVPSNTGYDIIFRKSHINALLISEDKQSRISSGQDHTISEKQLEEAAVYGVVTDGDCRISSSLVTGGRIFWLDDLHEINLMNAALEDSTERIEEENTLLEEESRIEAEKTRYETQNKLYDHLASILRPQLNRIDTVLANCEQDSPAAFHRKLSEASILLAYVKRRANLYMLSEKRQMLSAQELYFAIRESMEYLELHGILSRVNTPPDAPLNARLVITAYELFEYVIEAVLTEVHAVLTDITIEERFVMTIVLDYPGLLPLSDWNIQKRASVHAHIHTEQEDGLFYIRLVSSEEAAP